MIDINISKDELLMLEKVSGHLVDELKAEEPVPVVLSAINRITSDYPSPKPLAQGVLKILCEKKEFPFAKIIDCEGNSFVKITKPHHMSGMTSGEKKVSESIIKFFGASLQERNPSRDVWEDCLNTAFKKVNARVATIKLLECEYIQEENGKISLGKKGREYLSL